jgi:4-amino-4-deoxy-L-arabinose transferase-like glycosyltransferase
LAGFGPEAVAVDWDWSMSWDENLRAGALPSERLLTSARLANVFLLPFSLLCVYLTGVKIGGRATGILAVALLGSNALVLLHARRAMAEGSLVFGVSLATLGFVHARERPWLAGLGAGAAALAKLSSAALAPVGLLLAMWPGRARPSTPRSLVGRGLVYIGALVGEAWILEPILWRHPIQALAAIWRARLEFSAAQVAQMGALAPSLILRTPAARLASLIGNTFLQPPQFAEVGNYMVETAPQVRAYLAIPGNVLFTGIVAGGLALTICLLGVGLAAIQFRHLPEAKRYALGGLALASAVQATALYAAIPVPFQRYYIPLIPFASLWMAFGLASSGTLLAGLLRGSTRRTPAHHP